MADIQEIYSILLSRSFQDQLFSALPAKERQGKEILTLCPFCRITRGVFCSNQKPTWNCTNCGEEGDWIKYLGKRYEYDYLEACSYLAEQAGMEISPLPEADYNAYLRRAELLEAAQKIYIDALRRHISPLDLIWHYLWSKSYNDSDVKGMGIGGYTPEWNDQLEKDGFTDQDIRYCSLPPPNNNTWHHQISIIYKDQAGMGIALLLKSVWSEQERQSLGLSKYEFSSYLQENLGMVGFSSSRGSEKITFVEDPIDALYLSHIGIKAVSTIGFEISPTQINMLQSTGTKEVLIAIGKKSVNKSDLCSLIMKLTERGLKASIVNWPSDS